MSRACWVMCVQQLCFTGEKRQILSRPVLPQEAVICFGVFFRNSPNVISYSPCTVFLSQKYSGRSTIYVSGDRSWIGLRVSDVCQLSSKSTGWIDFVIMIQVEQHEHASWYHYTGKKNPTVNRENVFCRNNYFIFRHCMSSWRCTLYFKMLRNRI